MAQQIILTGLTYPVVFHLSNSINKESEDVRTSPQFVSLSNGALAGLASSLAAYPYNKKTFNPAFIRLFPELLDYPADPTSNPISPKLPPTPDKLKKFRSQAPQISTVTKSSTPLNSLPPSLSLIFRGIFGGATFALIYQGLLNESRKTSKNSTNSNNQISPVTSFFAGGVASMAYHASVLPFSPSTGVGPIGPGFAFRALTGSFLYAGTTMAIFQRITDGGVEVFSSDYDSIDDGPGPWEDPEWFSNFVNGTYTGFKWQCVELGRRYLLLNYGVVYDSIPMAYDIFRLKSVLRVSDNIRLKMHAIKNGEAELPQKGSLLIWSDIGEFKRTGHIAVIVNVGEDFVHIVEQNVDDTVWPKGQNYSRRLQAERKDGKITLKCTFPDTKILGWMNIDFNETYSYDGYPNCKPSQIKKEFVTLPASIANKPWLDESIPYLKVFTDSYGHELGSADKPSPYYTIPESFETALNFSTNELHKLFLDATDYVLHHEKDIGPHFRIPEKLWPKIRRSWFRHRHDIISGRFDYTITDKGLKVYEYNADSASCLLECGYIQSKWSEVAGVGNVGRSDADGLFKQLVETWTEKVVDGPLHLLCDNDKEEIYHSLYMKSAAEEAGIECHLLVGVESVKWTSCGSNLQDAEGRVIKNIWKTWSWRTALNQITDEEIQKYLTEHDENAKVTESSTDEGRKPPQLVDILLHDNIRIFEPLWTLLPSSKAILPVLWKLKPNHPYLLNSQFVLTPEFLKAGYVAKPVTGRAGANVSMFDAQGGLIEKTEGRWDQDQEVYQELAMLPKLDGEYVQFCTWAVGGAYAGTVLRIDKSGIINLQSSVSALRVISD